MNTEEQAVEEDVTKITPEQVVRSLQETQEGRIQLELAVQRAVIESQREEINRLKEGPNPKED